MKKILQTSAVVLAIATLSGCISVSEHSVESSKQISVMAQQAITTCGQGNVDKVSTTSFSCKAQMAR
jgi:uncharacterized protein YceK